jgi:hypothetical protein
MACYAGPMSTYTISGNECDIVARMIPVATAIPDHVTHLYCFYTNYTHGCYNGSRSANRYILYIPPSSLSSDGITGI